MTNYELKKWLSVLSQDETFGGHFVRIGKAGFATYAHLFAWCRDGQGELAVRAADVSSLCAFMWCVQVIPTEVTANVTIEEIAAKMSFPERSNIAAVDAVLSNHGTNEYSQQISECARWNGDRTGATVRVGGNVTIGKSDDCVCESFEDCFHLTP
jgi:hypothetical protein